MGHKWKSQWFNSAECEGMDNRSLLRMVVLRRQILLHSYLTYGLGNPILTDSEWEDRTQELMGLQREHGWNINFYDEIFKNWKGAVDWFPTNKGIDEHVNRVSNYILKYNTEKAVML